MISPGVAAGAFVAHGPASAVEDALALPKLQPHVRIRILPGILTVADHRGVSVQRGVAVDARCWRNGIGPGGAERRDLAARLIVVVRIAWRDLRLRQADAKC